MCCTRNAIFAQLMHLMHCINFVMASAFSAGASMQKGSYYWLPPSLSERSFTPMMAVMAWLHSRPALLLQQHLGDWTVYCCCPPLSLLLYCNIGPV